MLAKWLPKTPSQKYVFENAMVKKVLNRALALKGAVRLKTLVIVLC